MQIRSGNSNADSYLNKAVLGNITKLIKCRRFQFNDGFLLQSLIDVLYKMLHKKTYRKINTESQKYIKFYDMISVLLLD